MREIVCVCVCISYKKVNFNIILRTFKNMTAWSFVIFQMLPQIFPTHHEEPYGDSRNSFSRTEVSQNRFRRKVLTDVYLPSVKLVMCLLASSSCQHRSTKDNPHRETCIERHHDPIVPREIVQHSFDSQQDSIWV